MVRFHLSTTLERPLTCHCFSSLGWMSIVWTLVAIGLQQASLFALFKGNAKDGVWLQNAATTFVDTSVIISKVELTFWFSVSVVLSVPLARASDNVGRKWLIIVRILLHSSPHFHLNLADSTGMPGSWSCRHLYHGGFNVNRHGVSRELFVLPTLLTTPPQDRWKLPVRNHVFHRTSALCHSGRDSSASLPRHRQLVRHSHCCHLELRA